jgi:hypothetical protein
VKTVSLHCSGDKDRKNVCTCSVQMGFFTNVLDSWLLESEDVVCCLWQGMKEERGCHPGAQLGIKEQPFWVELCSRHCTKEHTNEHM